VRAAEAITTLVMGVSFLPWVTALNDGESAGKLSRFSHARDGSAMGQLLRCSNSLCAGREYQGRCIRGFATAKLRLHCGTASAKYQVVPRFVGTE
jgi:hypothetical protein